MNVDLKIGHIIGNDAEMKLVTFHDIKLLAYAYNNDRHEIELVYEHGRDEYGIKAGERDVDTFVFDDDGMPLFDIDYKEGFVVDGVEYIRGEKSIEAYWEEICMILQGIVIDGVLSKVD